MDVGCEERVLEMVFGGAEEFVEFYLEGGDLEAFGLMKWRGGLEEVREELVRITREEFGNGRIEIGVVCGVGKRPGETPSP